MQAASRRFPSCHIPKKMDSWVRILRISSKQVNDGPPYWEVTTIPLKIQEKQPSIYYRTTYRLRPVKRVPQLTTITKSVTRIFLLFRIKIPYNHENTDKLTRNNNSLLANKLLSLKSAERIA